jgi:hypothetical protein
MRILKKIQHKYQTGMQIFKKTDHQYHSRIDRLVIKHLSSQGRLNLMGGLCWFWCPNQCWAGIRKNVKTEQSFKPVLSLKLLGYHIKWCLLWNSDAGIYIVWELGLWNLVLGFYVMWELGFWNHDQMYIYILLKS